MRLPFFKQSDSASHKVRWLNQNELHELRVFAEQLESSTMLNNKQQSLHAGQLNSHQLGSGSDYAESRPYQVGDDPRSINWRLSARSQETFVKTYYADSRPSVNILLDQRKSMIFGSRKRLKISQALRAALLLSNASDIHGLDLKAWILNDKSLKFFDNSDNFLYRANHVVSTEKEITQISLNTALKEIEPQLTRGSLFYLISDLAEVKKSQLSVLANHCNVQAIHIIDPAELSLENIGSLWLQDSQGVAIKVETQNESQRLDFTNKIQEVQQQRKKAITDLNINYICLMTDTDNIQTQIPLPIKSSR